MNEQAKAVRFTDALYFLGELAVYVAVAWWGFTREAPAAIRWLLGLGSIVVFATTWAIFAAPRARKPLNGIAGVLFRVAWFGVGAVAVVALVFGS